jgi:hypothetical protein
MFEQHLQYDIRRNASVLGGSSDHIEQSARSRVVLATENLRRSDHDLPEPAQQCGTRVESEKRVRLGDLKSSGELIGGEGRQRFAVDPEGILRPVRKAAADEHVEARHGEAFGARVGLARAALLVAPRRSGPGIEQHGHHRKIEGGARHGCITLESSNLAKRLPAIETANREVTPARVERDLEIRIGSLDRRHDFVGTGAESFRMNREILEPSCQSVFQELVGAFAHRGGGEQAVSGIGFRG